MEVNATGAGRYNNRGGHLLKEEKERNTLAKNVSTIEKDITILAQQYMSRNATPFLTFVHTVEAYIGHLHAELENSWKLMLSARKTQRENTVVNGIGKSILSQICTTQLPSSSKQKLAMTPLTQTQKKSQSNAEASSDGTEEKKTFLGLS